MMSNSDASSGDGNERCDIQRSWNAAIRLAYQSYSDISVPSPLEQNASDSANPILGSHIPAYTSESIAVPVATADKSLLGTSWGSVWSIFNVFAQSLSTPEGA